MIDITKKYKTRDGRPVRILCTDGPDPEFPVVGVIPDAICTRVWTADGRFTLTCPHHPRDLIEDKPKLRVKRWINIRRYSGFAVDIWLDEFSSKFDAETAVYEWGEVVARAVPFVWVEGG
jgi:hypothetical protein